MERTESSETEHLFVIVDSSDERGQADRRAFMLVLGICSIIGPCDSVKETERERESLLLQALNCRSRIQFTIVFLVSLLCNPTPVFSASLSSILSVVPRCCSRFLICAWYVGSSRYATTIPLVLFPHYTRHLVRRLYRCSISGLHNSIGFRNTRSSV